MLKYYRISLCSLPDLPSLQMSPTTAPERMAYAMTKGGLWHEHGMAKATMLT